MGRHRIIDAVVSPTDLHCLTEEELAIVAAEIRDEIVRTCAVTGGHVASSLGAVEIIVALHSLLSSPRDRIVFDVGHQAYAHKILTGRLGRFGTLRQAGGVSGFTSPAESIHDAHWSGHASDALSVALGLALARDAREGDERVVAVVGDAAISGGMAFEALNHIGQEQERIVIVLNDNGMSIAPSVGGLARHLGRLRTWARYREASRTLAAGGGVAATLLRGAKGSLKHLLLPEGEMLFEQLGITCLGPVDGHDIGALRQTLALALAAPGPVLVHAVTRKGKGYPPAERHPEAFHGVGPFDRARGAPAPAPQLYSEAMAEALAQEVRAGTDVVAITAAMAEGTGLASFAREYPDRLIDVGICEEHAVGLAAGLAAGGRRPVVALYSTFLQRALDQLVVDVALPGLDVVTCVDRAGVVGGDGPTHTGAFDLCYLRMLPNMRVLVPSSASELAAALHAALAFGGPAAVRYPRAAREDDPGEGPRGEWELARAQVVREGDDAAILAFGSMVAPSLRAAELLVGQGVSVRVVDMRWAKPLDLAAILAAADTGLVLTVEEGSVQGGVGQAVLGELARMGSAVPAVTLGLPDSFVAQGVRAEVLAGFGLDAGGIARAVLDVLERSGTCGSRDSGLGRCAHNLQI